MEKVLVAQPDRAALVAGLRELARFYERHPEVPVVRYPDFLHCVLAYDDDAGVAEVQDVADALGLRATVDTHGAMVETAFGSVKYKVYYNSRADMADYRDRISYEAVVQTDARSVLSGAGLE